jgi:hypothetical protein
VQNQSNIIRLSSQDLLLSLALQLAEVLDIKGDLLLHIVPIALGNSRVESLGRLHRRTTSLVSTSRHKHNG